jgi:hypothetical protein
MNNDNRSSNHGHPRGSGSNPDAGAEQTLKSERIQVERKTFLFSLRENPRGRFLRITEDVGGRRDAIIVPATGLGDFAKIIEEMSRISESSPTDQPQQP